MREPGNILGSVTSLTRCCALERAVFSSMMIWRSLSISSGLISRRPATSAKNSMPLSMVSGLVSGIVSWYVVWSKLVKAFWCWPKFRPMLWKKSMVVPGGKFSLPLKAMCSR